MQFNFTFLKNFLAFVEVFKKPSVFTLSCFTFFNRVILGIITKKKKEFEASF